MIRCRVVVRGRVQGVSYRASCAQEAVRLGVTGWVANEPDGSVHAVFEGDSSAVQAMVAWSGSGPPGARVEGVDTTAEVPEGLRRFQVR